ncbi:methylesterase 10-like [Salvia miltiorrhiza]|uniref:methylesterase 10-like n=1 Tax=Salvia miltiorrhiza TaxID=226208 RepID=UPI0025AC280A|nr:methylesterase 10-like [Salvia miltiorrhiza]
MNMIQKGETKHFVLVHGFCHGSWCWYKLAAALESKGCRATALDLAGPDRNDQLHRDSSSFSDYVRPLTDFLASLPGGERVVLVGHSYGGLAISVAMENFPAKISLAVFLTAYMPNCADPPASLIQEFFKRSSTKSFMDCEFTFDEDGVPLSAVFGPEYMATTIYRNCSAEDLEMGKKLIRPSLFFMKEMSKNGVVSEEKYGLVKRCYVICEDDDVMDEEFQRYNIEKSLPHEVISIEAAGHMPMLTKTLCLSSSLLQLSHKYY